MSAGSDPVPISVDPEILRALRELAGIWSTLQPADGANRRLISLDDVRNRLRQAGCTAEAINAAVGMATDNGWLTKGKLEIRRPVEHRHIVEAEAKIVHVEAVTATPSFLAEFRVGIFSQRPREIVLLLHGIKTHGFWQSMVQRVLEEIPNLEVRPVRFRFLGARRFWRPGRAREKRIREVLTEVQKAQRDLQNQPGGRLSVIAHSFGTHIITSILLDNPNVTLHRLILCGSIVSLDYRWDHVSHRLSNNVINDYGTRDIWPVMAQLLGIGFGDTGRHKFGRAEVIDRAHDLNHTEFFEKKGKKGERFARKYWKPLFESGEVVGSPWNEKASSPEWLVHLSDFRLGRLLLILQRFTLVLYTGRHAGTSRGCPGVSRTVASRPQHHRARTSSSL